ncbi:MAG TPA: uroporphyrinogen-III C-methyltransferase [Niabella sp.]|nr:uroporphyrinogen-III C-methyltransferase [Niabella sp.]HQW14980.1 uroporphyrinogen-III C-methyltransferase [Niabella sp.]HQX20128.1 uroporphyrinogen-III C-methyltransferase [Niabella sp.]HQX40360.1 uroporphyrinogen-III C-methyltransferase [Niabella sp.]HRB06733.1 uroporphyrinogen-III C-methyltransferase [Niabella sp.]
MSKIILVGAGPGDPDLITLKAIKALQEADVVLYDALANENLLKYCSPHCVMKYVGKRSGHHTLSQDEINRQIIQLGRKYDCVVRLKGGDPFVFGRAWEEIEAAQQAGMEVEVVPGISSAIAAAGSEMIPMTARGTNESFWVITGTTRSGRISSDISLAAQSNATVVLLMAMKNLKEIMDVFIRYGKSTTPVAIIQNATLPYQKSIFGTTSDICRKAAKKGIENPAVIVIGEVVKLAVKMEKTNQLQHLLASINH